jgi:hypothetical protein
MRGETVPTVLEHSLVVDAPMEAVFSFIGNPRNDSDWCPRVVWCEQRVGGEPGPGARYEALHRPTFQKSHSRWIDVVEFTPPTRMRSRQEDDIAVFTIDYLLEPTVTGTRLTQRDEIAWKIPRLHHPIARRIVRRHMGDQLATLKRLLES